MRRLFVLWWCCASAITILALGWFPGVLVAVGVGLVLFMLVDALTR